MELTPARAPARPIAALLALGAIAMWGSLAPLGVALQKVPPFLLTGLGLLAGSSIGLGWSALRFVRGGISRAEAIADLRLPWSTLALGVYGLFGFHFLLFIALRHAPPVQANLVNYLWPLGMVLLAPIFLPSVPGAIYPRSYLLSCGRAIPY